jgi:hypothetical protein
MRKNIVLLIASLVLIILCIWSRSGSHLPEMEVDFRFKNADKNHDEKLNCEEFEE